MSFNMTLPIICALYGISAFLLVIAIGGVTKRSVLDKGNTDDWLYTNGFQKVYRAIFNSRDPVAISKMYGLEYDKYMLDCKILNREPNFEKEAMMRVIGVFSFIFSIFISLLLMSIIPVMIGCLLYYILAASIPKRIHKAALEKKNTVQHDLSRFVDLFLSALEASMPVETAIQVTSNIFPGVLSEELQAAMVQTQLGARNWQQALEYIAQKYEVDDLSDFVVNITTAYNKGVSVTEAVAREAYDIKQSAILRAKEETAKMSSAVLGPVTIFKLVPLILVMGIPIFMQAMSFVG